MHSILGRLNKTQGVQGSMVVNKDGIVVASDLGVDADETSLGAIASSLLTAIENTVKRVSFGKLTRFVLTGSENKVAILDTGPALLLVLLRRDTNMGMVNLELKQASEAVAEKAKM